MNKRVIIQQLFSCSELYIFFPKGGMKYNTENKHTHFIYIYIGPRRRWVDNIRMVLGEVGWGDVDWIGLAQDRNRWRALVNSVLNLRVP
jgi:hypothetical protein